MTRKRLGLARTRDHNGDSDSPAAGPAPADRRWADPQALSRRRRNCRPGPRLGYTMPHASGTGPSSSRPRDSAANLKSLSRSHAQVCAGESLAGRRRVRVRGPAQCSRSRSAASALASPPGRVAAADSELGSLTALPVRHWQATQRDRHGSSSDSESPVTWSRSGSLAGQPDSDPARNCRHHPGGGAP
jgi:hypothetical protein